MVANMTVKDLILENLQNQRVSGTYCDLKIELGCHNVWVHSAVVCPFSGYLDLHKESFSVRMDVDHECLQCLESLLDVMYGLDVDLPDSHLDHALEYCRLLMPTDVLMEPLTRIGLDVKPPPALMMVNVKLETHDEDTPTRCDDYIEFEDNKHETFIKYQGDKRKMRENDELRKNKIIKTSHKRKESKTLVKREKNVILSKEKSKIVKKRCLQCKMEFRSMGSLCTHLQTTKHSSTVCSVCREPLTDGTFQHHVYSHLPFPCSVCGSRFKHKSTLEAHTAIHITNKPYACPDCDKAFKLPSLLTSHISSVHPQPKNDDAVAMRKLAEKKLHCLECNNLFSCVDTLYRHLQLKKHSSSVCSICDRTLPDGETLEEHLPLRHSHWAPLICAYCDLRFKHKEKLALHIGSNHADGKIINKEVKVVPAKKKKKLYERTEPKKLGCLGCDFKCTTTNYLYRHLQLTNHSSGMCSICNWTLPDGEVFEQHLLFHVPFMCPLCDMRFTHAIALERHVTTHAQDRTHVCTVCNKAFKSLRRLQEHEARTHGEAKHLCDLCGYSTKYLLSLRCHKQKHSGVPPLRCDYPGCGHTTYRKSGMKHHQLTHAERRPFVCDLCGEAYKRKATLDRHRKCHEDKPKLQCSYCSYEVCVSRKDNLQAHMKRRHPDVVEKPSPEEESTGKQ